MSLDATQSGFSVRFGEDHVARVSGTPFLDAIAPHVGVIVLKHVTESQFSDLVKAAELIKAVASASGNQTVADNFVCEKR